MKRILFAILIILISAFQSQLYSQDAPKIKTLIIDGQNNHDQWPKLTFMLKQEMEATGLFAVEVERTTNTWKGDEYLEGFIIDGMQQTESFEEPVPNPGFSPDFSKYDLVISNFGWNAASWLQATKENFEKFIENGGGLVVFHAADNSFPEWEAYNKMIGLGGWGDRTEKDGPYVYYNDASELIRDETPGSGGAHGPQSEYQIQVRDSVHPITKGMPALWMHTKDELYNSLRGPAENMEVLATAYSDPNNKGTGRHEPALIALTYGKGRIFHNIMGHADYSVQCVGFLTSMLRGAEWAATGKVTQEIPKDFPIAEKSSSRPFEK